MKKTWKYLWAWNEEFVSCGGQGAGCARAIAKDLKNKGFNLRLKIAESSYMGHTLIIFFCDDEKTKNEIQKELLNYGYVDDMKDDFSWSTNEDEIAYALNR